MSEAPGSTNAWMSCLTAEHRLLSSFLSLLQEEQQALLSAQTDSLFDIADKKNRLVADLTKQAQQRHLLGAVPEDAFPDKLHELQDTIRRLAVQAVQTNQVNGELIQIRLQHNQKALQVLQNAAKNAAGTYGPDGHTFIPAVPGRSLGQV